MAMPITSALRSVLQPHSRLQRHGMEDMDGEAVLTSIRVIYELEPL